MTPLRPPTSVIGDEAGLVERVVATNPRGRTGSQPDRRLGSRSANNHRVSRHHAWYRHRTRARAALDRHRWLYWTAAVALVSVSAASLQARAAALDRARSQWDTLVTVWVADADLSPGDQVAGNSTARRVPALIAPDGALQGDVGTVTQPVGRGAILTDVSVTRSTGALALAPSGTVVVGVRESVPVGASVGEPVAVVSEGVMVAPRAMVIGLDDGIVLLALPIGDAPVVTAASDGHSVALVRLIADGPTPGLENDPGGTPDPPTTGGD